MTKATSDPTPKPEPVELEEAALAAASAGYLPEVNDEVLVSFARKAGPAASGQTNSAKWELSEFDALRPKP